MNVSGIAHISTVHHRHDTRIRVKEVATLSEAFGYVALIVQDGKGNADEDDGRVRIMDIGQPGSRAVRAVRGSWRMWRALRRMRPAIVHFHDVELIPLGFFLKIAGYSVIYDVHEDVPRDILAKDWIPLILKWPVSKSAAILEWVAGRLFDGVVVVTPTIARRYPASTTVLVQNYPLLDEFNYLAPSAYVQRSPLVAYVGGLTQDRGAHKMVKAMGCLPKASDLRLALAGSFSPPGLERELSKLDGWARVDVLGWLSRNEVASLLGRAAMGLVVLQPVPNLVAAQPNKLFEYMAAGLPVIASDFPLWREIVDGARCGLLVDPEDPEAIAMAMQWIIENPQEAEEMGRRGRSAVEKKYNWDKEVSKLVDFYTELFARTEHDIITTHQDQV